MASNSPVYPPGFLEEYGGDKLSVVCTAMLVLTSLFGGLRFYARRSAETTLGWDDFVLPFAWITNVACIVPFYVSIRYGGLGHHIAALVTSNPNQLVVYYKSLYATEVSTYLSAALSRISILCLYLRIFVSRTSRVSCHVLTGIVIVTSLGMIVAVTFQCHPVQFQWDKSIRGGTCFYQKTVYRLLNLINVATDLAMLVLPLPALLKLHTSRGHKIGLICTFLTASVGIIAACVRTVEFFQHDPRVDITWNGVDMFIWVITESSMYFIAACLPVLRPVFVKILPSWLVARVQRTNKQHSGNHDPALPLNTISPTRIPHPFVNLSKTQDFDDDDDADAQHQNSQGSVSDSEPNFQNPHPRVGISTDVSTT